MELTRRAVLGLGAALPLAACVKGQAPVAAADTRGDRWAKLRAEFDFDETSINVDNGWSAVPPKVVTARYDAVTRDVRRLPAYHLNHLMEHGPEVVAGVAGLLGVPPGEIALVRNSTEGLGTVLFGIPLASGDEIVCSQADYWAVLRMLKAREAAGAVLRRIDVPVPAPDPKAIVDAYAAAIGPRTKIVLLTHVSNVTGQTLPVRDIAAIAHGHGAVVVVDGAQSLAVLDYRVKDLDCDYYCTSLHKWLMAPLGTGVMWMRPELATALPSRFDAGAGTPGMEKFSEAGQVDLPAFIAIPEALAFHARIGAAAKEARLRELTSYLRGRLSAAIPNARFFAPPDAWASCAILALAAPDPQKLADTLWQRDRVLVQAIAYKYAPAQQGLRFSPSLHTSFDDLDRVAKAVASLRA